MYRETLPVEYSLIYSSLHTKKSATSVIIQLKENSAESVSGPKGILRNTLPNVHLFFHNKRLSMMSTPVT